MKILDFNNNVVLGFTFVGVISLVTIIIYKILDVKFLDVEIKKPGKE